jgi:hypothetical protein
VDIDILEIKQDTKRTDEPSEPNTEVLVANKLIAERDVT